MEQPPSPEGGEKWKILKELLTFDVCPIDVANILLAAEKVKPVTRFGMFVPESEYQDDPGRYEDIANRIEDLLEDLGLYVGRKVGVWGEGNKDPATLFEFVVSHDLPTLDEYINLSSKGSDSPGYAEGMGRYYGFPATAIEAHGSGETISFEELPAEVRSSPEGKFFAAARPFLPSNNQWPEEIETIKQWMEKIREVAPSLYEQIIESKKGK